MGVQPFGLVSVGCSLPNLCLPFCLHRFFLRSDALLFLGLFGAWSIAAVALAFLLSIPFSRTKPATIVSYLLILLGAVASTSINQVVFGLTKAAHPAYMAWAPFAFYRGVFLLSQVPAHVLTAALAFIILCAAASLLLWLLCAASVRMCSRM